MLRRDRRLLLSVEGQPENLPVLRLGRTPVFSGSDAQPAHKDCV
jgi:hypothetical protein